MILHEIIEYLETQVPLNIQESYDNCGLLTGELSQEITQTLISLDCTAEIVEEAIQNNCNLIICHHPIVFKGLLKDNTPMKPLGGGGKKVTRSLTSIYTKSGASNTIPKTDMYTGSYQISLKKKGGSQLASAAAGETKGMFNAALEHYSGNTEKIDEILKAIDENFTKLSTDMTKTQLANVGSGKEDKQGNIAPEKKDLSPEDKKAFKQFLSTEEFHKKLNDEISENFLYKVVAIFFDPTGVLSWPYLRDATAVSYTHLTLADE